MPPMNLSSHQLTMTVLLTPDVANFAGNVLAAAESGGIVLRARVPIVLTRRADNARARAASIAVRVLLAHSRREQLGLR
jgi:phosphate acetyltransferase